MEWRDTHQIFKDNNQVKDLEEIAQIMGISKKTLDYYYLELRTAEFFGFDFDANLDQRMGFLRTFIEEQSVNFLQKSPNAKIPRQLQLKYRLPENRARRVSYSQKISQKNSEFELKEGIQNISSIAPNQKADNLKPEIKSAEKEDDFDQTLISANGMATDEEKEESVGLENQNLQEVVEDASRRIFISDYKENNNSPKNQIQEFHQIEHFSGVVHENENYTEGVHENENLNDSINQKYHPYETKRQNVHYQSFLNRIELSKKSEESIFEEDNLRGSVLIQQIND